MRKFFTALAALTMSIAAWAQATVPASFAITDENSFAAWTVIDNNASISSNTWGYGDAEAVYPEDKSKAADDWLISPALTLVAGTTYNIDYYIVQKSTYSFDKQKYAITVGNAATIEAQSTTLASNESFTSKMYSKQTCTFTPTESGTYYLGVHLYSASYNGNCGFQKFEVSTAPVLPKQIDDLNVTAGEQGALTATLTWTNPSTTSTGAALAELTGVKVMRDNIQVATVAGGAGQAMTYIDQSLEIPGTYSYSVIAYNSDGDAPGTATQVTSSWIGKDTPKAVSNLAASAEGTQVSLTWTAPTQGAHNGYINPANLSYRITRNGYTIAEAWTGEQPYVDTVEDLGRYNYSVFAAHDGVESTFLSSTTVIAGAAFGVPYSETFETSDVLDFFTTFNNDGSRMWTYYNSSKGVHYWGGTTTDAWLITPAIKMEAGKSYKVSFRTGLENGLSSTHYKNLQVTVGQGTTAEAQTTNIFDEQITSAIMETKEGYFAAPTTGNYNLGFRVHGQSSVYALFVDDILVEESQSVPAVSTQLTATAVAPVEDNPNKDYTIAIGWTNPSVDMAGKTLQQLDSVEVMLNGAVAYTATQCTPGAAMSHECKVTEPGVYTIDVINYANGAPSPKSTITTAWVGHDTPAPVTEVSLVDNGGYAAISFVAPTAGANNGYINPNALTYRIVRNPGEVEVANGYTLTTFTDQATLDLGNYTYTVYAQLPAFDNMLESEGATSNSMVFGSALSLPYEANMTDANHMALWTIVDNNNNGKTWEHKTDLLAYTSMSDADDYAFTPPLNMGAGKLQLTYSVKGYNYRYSDEYDVVLARSTNPNSPEAEITLLESLAANALQSSMYTTRTVEFNIATTGIYYIGFHNKSNDSWGLYINSTLVELTEPATAVTDINSDAMCYYNHATQSLVVSGMANVVVSAINGTVVAAAQGVVESMNLSHLSAGIYVASVNMGDKQHVVKFVK